MGEAMREPWVLDGTSRLEHAARCGHPRLLLCRASVLPHRVRVHERQENLEQIGRPHLLHRFSLLWQPGRVRLLCVWQDRARILHRRRAWNPSCSFLARRLDLSLLHEAYPDCASALQRCPCLVVGAGREGVATSQGTDPCGFGCCHGPDCSLLLEGCGSHSLPDGQPLRDDYIRALSYSYSPGPLSTVPQVASSLHLCSALSSPLLRSRVYSCGDVLCCDGYAGLEHCCMTFDRKKRPP
mmetsp:Transcript_63588/g.138496  ORF Transcript_63588/g.138496 Transcript_63588/m.138496 type:complete len:240 (+) Transcript_63588:847-1566(+)